LFLLAVLPVACDNSEEPPPPPPVDPSGTIRTWAGKGIGGFDGDGRPILESALFEPIDLTITPAGDVYVLDWNNHIIRHVTAQGTFETIMGYPGWPGDGPEYPATGADRIPPGVPGTDVLLNHPTHFLPMPDGTLLLTAWHNHKLRRYDPATGLVLVRCGKGAGYDGDDVPEADALLNQPTQTTLGPDGSRYILDQRNQRVRKIDLAGIIHTVVGTGVAGYNGDGIDPLTAQIRMPAGSNPQPGGAVAFDADGNLYISDTLNHRIRRVNAGFTLIETVAGTGAAGYNGDGPATDASLNNPRDIVFGPDGRLYVADEWNDRVRAIDLDAGTITTVAGNGVRTFGGDGGQATAASLNRPTGLEFDADGNLYIADSYNHRIRRVAH
jgi:hypothetical protein